MPGMSKNTFDSLDVCDWNNWTNAIKRQKSFPRMFNSYMKTDYDAENLCG